MKSDKTMKNYIVGTVLLIAGGILMVVLRAQGVTHQIAAMICMSISLCGFIIQLCAIFGTKLSFDKKLRQTQEAHEAKMRAIKDLPPEEAIQELLRG